MASKHKDRDERIVKLRKQGLSIEVLAARFGTTRQVIKVVCYRARKQELA